MPEERDARFIRRYAAAVILHANEPAAALTHLDADVAGAGIQAVFDQLFDRRCGSLDHLAGGDLVGNLRSKNTNRHAGILPHSRTVD